MTVRLRFRRVSTIVVCALLLIAVWEYASDAVSRKTATECINVISQSRLYRAQSCVTGGNGSVEYYVGRLYDANGGALLARTDFDSMDGGAPEFMPDESAVLFKGSNAGIDIPPNWRDRLRAKLP